MPKDNEANIARNDRRRVALDCIRRLTLSHVYEDGPGSAACELYGVDALEGCAEEFSMTKTGI
jgi:hypothetical protein